MRTVIPLYKFQGETPLEAIRRFQGAFPAYASVPITYAGRLDPMADGLLLLLAAQTVHQKNEWLSKDKTYIVDVLFGIETDTYDALGRIVSNVNTLIDPQQLSTALKTLVGLIEQPLPPYSSYKMQGKPLFEWAREGRIREIQIPTKQRIIFSADVLGVSTIRSSELLARVEKDIKRVTGDFRQTDVLHDWQSLLHGNDQDWQLARLEISCSSGTYMRALVHELGHTVHTGAITLSITRTQVGPFTLPSVS